MGEDSDHSNLSYCLDKALQQSQTENEKVIKTVSRLLHRSVEYGRVERVLGENPGADACLEYVEKVINNYDKHYDIVTCLERKDTEAWTKTIKNIQLWANGFFKKHNIYGPLRMRAVEECVPNAVLAYLSSTYHFDVDFDAWFCVLVHNVCRKYIKEQRHPNRTIQEAAVSYDKTEYLQETIADVKEADSRQRRELRESLIAAIGKLSSKARQQIIILYYFSGYSFKEVAERMDRSMNAIYKLHFDAIQELRDIWMDD